MVLSLCSALKGVKPYNRPLIHLGVGLGCDLGVGSGLGRKVGSQEGPVLRRKTTQRLGKEH